MRCSFGPIESLMLFGSGRVLTRAIQDLLGKKRLSVVTGKRLLKTPSHEARMTLEEFVAVHRIPLEVSDDVNRAPQVHRWIHPTTLGISFGAPWIFRKPLIEVFQGRLLNGHATHLPQDRGGGGFSWRILRGQRMGCSVYHLVTPDIDAGPILKHHEYPFPPTCKIPREFEDYAEADMSRLLHELLADIDRGVTFELLPQAEHLSTYWPRLKTDSQAYIDWSWSLCDLEAFIDAFDEPYPGASTFVNGKRVRLRKARADCSDGRFHPFQTGIVYRKTAEQLFVAANDGSLIIGEVLNDQVASVLHTIKVGDRFFTPAEYLEQAKRTRIFYTSRGVTVEK